MQLRARHDVVHPDLSRHCHLMWSGKWFDHSKCIVFKIL
jgi:hypothetical protein